MTYLKSIFLCGILLIFQLHSASTSYIFVNESEAVWTPGLSATPSDALDSGEAVPTDFFSDIFVSNAEAVWTPGLSATPPDALDSGEAVPTDFFSDIFVSNAEAVWTLGFDTPPTYNISGYVFDNFLAGQEGVFVQNGINTAITAPSGYYSLTGLLSGVYNFSYSKTGFSTGYLEITISDNDVLNANKTIYENISSASVKDLVNVSYATN